MQFDIYAGPAIVCIYPKDRMIMSKPKISNYTFWGTEEVSGTESADIFIRKTHIVTNVTKLKLTEESENVYNLSFDTMGYSHMNLQVNLPKMNKEKILAHGYSDVAFRIIHVNRPTAVGD